MGDGSIAAISTSSVGVDDDDGASVGTSATGGDSYAGNSVAGDEGTMYRARPRINNTAPNAPAVFCRSGGKSILPPSWEATASRRKNIPPTTRMVCKGVSFRLVMNSMFL